MGLKEKHIWMAVTNDLNQDQRLQRIAGSLSKAGATITLVGREKKDSIHFDHKEFQSIRMRLWFSKGIRFYIEYNLRLIKVLWNKRVDILVANDLDTVLGIGILSKLRRIPFVFDAHELYEDTPELKKSPIKRWIWNRLGRFFLNRHPYNYTVNESLKNILKNKYHAPYEVFYNWPQLNDLLAKKSIPDPKCIRLVYQGMLNVGRGLFVLLDLVEACPQYHITLIGNGDIEEAVRDEVQRRNLHPNVTLMGFVEPERLLDLTPQFDFGMNLLEGDSKSYYYSSANKYFDYTMAGIPSVNMNFPEYASFIKKYDNGLLINDLSVESVHQSIQVVINNSKRYETLTNNCLTARQELNWQSQEPKLLTFYQNII